MASVSSFDPSSTLSNSISDPTALRSLDELPVGFMPFEKFVQNFSLGDTSTEQIHEGTKNLSQTMQSNVVQGLKMLLEADQAVLDGFERFIPVIDSLAPELATRLKAGGCVYPVGAGSSGRVAIAVAARCNSLFPNRRNQIRGVIAGGDSAFIRAREGFEDSEKEGEDCLRSFNLKAQDTVFLISSSGSASFNVGCGHFAANRGAQVFYFYNSDSIPPRTQKLFDRHINSVHPLKLDIGPQAIAGSTRLQGASLAEMCLGALLGTALLHCSEETAADANQYARNLLANMRKGNFLLERHLETIAEFVKKEAAVFLSPFANFRRVHDQTSQGYVTFIGGKNVLGQVIRDAVEGSPTFSLNPTQKEEEVQQKTAEVRAYVVGEQDNDRAWEALLGREIEKEALADTRQFLLALEAEGNHSYEKRPKGAGNFVVGVAKLTKGPEELTTLLDLLNASLSQGGDGGLIVLSKDKIPPLPDSPLLTLFLEEVPNDPLGLVETLLLKQILNLISNASMVLAGKVHGGVLHKSSF